MNVETFVQSQSALFEEEAPGARAREDAELRVIFETFVSANPRSTADPVLPVAGAQHDESEQENASLDDGTTLVESWPAVERLDMRRGPTTTALGGADATLPASGDIDSFSTDGPRRRFFKGM